MNRQYPDSPLPQGPIQLSLLQSPNGDRPTSNSQDSGLAGTPTPDTRSTSRREYRWSKSARDLLRANAKATGPELSFLVTQLAKESGFPRWACWRFVRRMGIRSKRQQRRWTEQEQQRLEKLIDLHPV